MTEKIRLGISSCLLGERVRYDGQHKLDPFLAETLGTYVEYVPVCPEVECGLPVPREAMRLVGSVESPRLLTQRTARDLTDQMLAWAAAKLNSLANMNLCGFIFKAKSPSSGMERVKVYNGHGGLSGRGSGLFAREFMKRFPLLPVEDEGRLQDPDLRENFIERIFTLGRYREAIRTKASTRALMRFHEANKYLILSHSPADCRAMGALLATSSGEGVPSAAAAYEQHLLRALKLKCTPGKHANVLQHMLGFFKDLLDADEKQEMLEILQQFRAGDVPLIVPVTLMKHHVRKFRVAYLANQSYLQPHPIELRLRNHA